MSNFLKISPLDNVATALQIFSAGDQVNLVDGSHLIINEEIEFGHKFALQHINKGDKVYKYGEVIGVAIRDIEMGEHVHTHNLEGTRGRGDL
ncbi:MAG: UxaA family hydrolase [Kurthia sp.]|nr:UxaA family hydrolase [Candidatus Kurthia equi]